MSLTAQAQAQVDEYKLENHEGNSKQLNEIWESLDDIFQSLQEK